MYSYSRFPIRPVLADIPLQLPINLLLAWPDYVTRDPHAPRHNAIEDIKNILSSADWPGVTKIIKPRIWAPALTDGELEAFAAEPFIRAAQPAPYSLFEDLRAEEFTSTSQNDIVHFTGYVIGFRNNPILYLGNDNKIEAGALRDALVMMRTRLLILTVPSDQFEYAARLGELVVGSGGPATLIVSPGYSEPLSTLDLIPELFVQEAAGNWATDPPWAIDRYFTELFADIIHNLPLPMLGRWREDVGDKSRQDLEDKLSIRLLYGEDGERLLDLTPWMDSLLYRIMDVGTNIRQKRLVLEDLETRSRKLLHRSQQSVISNLVRDDTDAVSELIDEVNENVTKLNDARRNIHYHESQGVIPLSEIADTVPQLEQTASQLSAYRSDLEQALQDEAKRAPRVLNANFRDPRNPSEMLRAYEPLEQGSLCYLLVDVGPAWDKKTSIVKGAAAFPTHSLPQDRDGWDIEVLFVSESFSPHTVRAEFWLPKAGGRSYPYSNGQRAERPGPVVLALRAPSLAESLYTASYTAHGRLSLYYENNLLQSALVNVGVARSLDTVLDEENAVEVDFVLTGSFQNADRFARRALKCGEETEKSLPVRLSLTLNDDGNGNHRVVVKPRNTAVAPASGAPAPSSKSLPPGWTSYDPQAATTTLELARTELRNLFFVRDAKGNADPNTSGLNNDNGKTREQFKRDLQTFALLGNTLFEMFTAQIRAEDNQSALNWTKQLTKTLAETSVIQVARTGDANYAFPWALVYEHPMPGPTFDFCPIVDEEWDVNGVRSKPPQTSCRHKDEVGHEENVYCPYGFWGLKHIIEQPPSALRKRNGEYELGEVKDEIPTGSQINMTIGITQALQDLERLKTHLKSIKSLPSLVAFDPDATDVDTLRKALASPTVVYFACHGEYDTGAKLPYIGIGPTLNEPKYRVYPNTVSGWARTERLPNLAAWLDNRPLVFINGCHTTDLKPGEVLNFVTSFIRAGAAGIIGTEFSVQPPVAFEVAQKLLKKITSRSRVGDAIYEVRWELANKGNLLGLAYTAYCLSNLHLSPNGS